MPNVDPLRGEVWDVNLDPTKGREQAGRRPALIVSVDQLNKSAAELVIVLPITGTNRHVPLHVELEKPNGGVTKTSYVKPEAIRSISIERLIKRRGKVDVATMAQIDDHLRVVLDL